MGDSLLPLKPSASYNGIIKTSDNTAVDGTEKQLTDGEGNNIGAKVSTNKLVANQFKIENAPTTTETTVTTIDSNGDIGKRVLDASAFAGAAGRNVLYAKTNGVQVSPVSFYEVGTGVNNSYATGSDLSINGTSTGVLVSGASSLVKASAAVKLRFIGSADKIQLSIFQNLTEVANQTYTNPYGVASAEQLVNLSAPFITATSSDKVELKFTETVGSVDVQESTILEVEKIV